MGILKRKRKGATGIIYGRFILIGEFWRSRAASFSRAREAVQDWVRLIVSLGLLRGVENAR